MTSRGVYGVVFVRAASSHRSSRSRRRNSAANRSAPHSVARFWAYRSRAVSTRSSSVSTRYPSASGASELQCEIRGPYSPRALRPLEAGPRCGSLGSRDGGPAGGECDADGDQGTDRSLLRADGRLRSDDADRQHLHAAAPALAVRAEDARPRAPVLHRTEVGPAVHGAGRVPRARRARHDPHRQGVEGEPQGRCGGRGRPRRRLDADASGADRGPARGGADLRGSCSGRSSSRRRSCRSGSRWSGTRSRRRSRSSKRSPAGGPSSCCDLAEANPGHSASREHG